MLIVQKMDFPFDSIFFLVRVPALATLHLPQTENRACMMRKTLSVILTDLIRLGIS